MKPVTKAIIPVAGWGTRRLPITKSIEKSMLPIGNRPLVDYVVADCIAAGVTDIYFVVSKKNSQLEQFYTPNNELNDYLKAQRKAERIRDITPPANVSFHFVIQDPNDKYGTSIPVALAVPYIGSDESVLVLMGDDFLYSADGVNDIKRLVTAAADGQAAILGVEIAASADVSQYGVFALNEAGGFAGIVEKPRPSEVPSRLMNVSKYVLTPAFLAAICEHAASEQVGEYFITDPISSLVASGHAMQIVTAHGEYLDGGNVDAWLHANRVVLGDLSNQ